MVEWMCVCHRKDPRGEVLGGPSMPRRERVIGTPVPRTLPLRDVMQHVAGTQERGKCMVDSIFFMSTVYWQEYNGSIVDYTAFGWREVQHEARAASSWSCLKWQKCREYFGKEKKAVLNITKR